jgi:hypothetical protein
MWINGTGRTTALGGNVLSEWAWSTAATQHIDSPMKYADNRPYADPEVAARKLVEIAAGIEPTMPGRIYIELVNYPMLFKLKANAAEYKAGLDLAIERGWLELHESGTYVRLLKSGEMI